MKPLLTPFLTVDIVIELLDRPGRPIVLIERRNPPPGWALPGGFVDRGEPVEAAARREALEETSLTVTLQYLLGIYSDPSRDPRMHTASVVYVATATGDPIAQDDARQVRIVSIEELPIDLAFDHNRILTEYRDYYRRHGKPAPITGG